MEFDVNLDLEQKQGIFMTSELQLSIELLQFSTQELNEYIEEELESNPILERDNSNQNSYDNYHGYNKNEINYENFIKKKPNLREHLEYQLYLVFEDKNIEVAKYIIGNLDQDGFLQINLEEVSEKFNMDISKVTEILKKIQNLDPVGVAARNLKETLLIQLKSLSLNTELAETIVNDYLEELKKKL